MLKRCYGCGKISKPEQPITFQVCSRCLRVGKRFYFCGVPCQRRVHVMHARECGVLLPADLDLLGRSNLSWLEVLYVAPELQLFGRWHFRSRTWTFFLWPAPGAGRLLLSGDGTALHLEAAPEPSGAPSGAPEMGIEGVIDEGAEKRRGGGRRLLELRADATHVRLDGARYDRAPALFPGAAAVSAPAAAGACGRARFPPPSAECLPPPRLLSPHPFLRSPVAPVGPRSHEEGDGDGEEADRAGRDPSTDRADRDPSTEGLPDVRCARCGEPALDASRLARVARLPSPYWRELSEGWSCGPCCSFAHVAERAGGCGDALLVGDKELACDVRALGLDPPEAVALGDRAPDDRAPGDDEDDVDEGDDAEENRQTKKKKAAPGFLFHGTEWDEMAEPFVPLSCRRCGFGLGARSAGEARLFLHRLAGVPERDARVARFAVSVMAQTAQALSVVKFALMCVPEREGLNAERVRAMRGAVMGLVLVTVGARGLQGRGGSPQVWRKTCELRVVDLLLENTAEREKWDAEEPLYLYFEACMELREVILDHRIADSDISWLPME